MEFEQILAMIIFLVMFIAIMSGKLHRFIPALCGALLTGIMILAVVDGGPDKFWDVLRLGDFVDGGWWFGKHSAEAVHEASGAIEIGGVNWQTIVFIGGMMTMVEGLGAVGFFRWICFLVAKVVRYKVIPILVMFMLLSGFLSMFIDSITVLLFLSMVTIELSRLLKFDPVPMIIAEIFAANCGGAATMCGDPPNIIIGTALNYTFFDFFVNTGPIAWLGMIITLVMFYFFFRNVLSKPFGVAPGESAEAERYPDPSEAIVNPTLFKINSAIFLLVVVLLVSHSATGMSVALIGVIAAALTLIAARGQIPHIIKGIDWRTLLFFFGLFVTVGGLEATGVLEKLAHFIEDASGGSINIVIPFILWISAIASAIVDNIPFAATMVPVIKSLSSTPGLSLPTMAWTLALGTDIGGNATPIGASANVVGTAIAEREGHPIGWGRFCKYTIPGMILVVGLCNLYLILRYA
jgi:Na+/H+ antiporter NhaD/arsenite permease-like protein